MQRFPVTVFMENLWHLFEIFIDNFNLLKSHFYHHLHWTSVKCILIIKWKPILWVNGVEKKQLVLSLSFICDSYCNLSVALRFIKIITRYIESVLVSYGPPGGSIIGISCHRRQSVLSAPPWEVLCAPLVPVTCWTRQCISRASPMQSLEFVHNMNSWNVF